MSLINCKECNKQISDLARACPHCGAPVQRVQVEGTKSNLAAVAVIATISVVLGLLYVYQSTSSFSDESGAVTLPQPVGAPAPVVTMAEYNRISEGMTYEQVRAIIGAPGQELSRSDLADIKTVMYSWANANGSNMNAMFQNGALINKAQFGLP